MRFLVQSFRDIRSDQNRVVSKLYILVKDYISEKFWRNSLASSLVPVVYGPHIDDCKRVAPPNSFIHVSSFKTNVELVQYLDYLGRIQFCIQIT